MEYEAKFHLPHLADIRKTILAHGGRLQQERMLERNLRFDDKDRSLSASHQVLRLRQDCDITMTYKQGVDRFESRIEIELKVDDLDIARSFLEALGYQLMHRYEKYREIYTLDQVQIMLDELPFGYFVEIEADSLETVQEQALELGFDWDQRVQTPYLAIFNHLRQNLDLQLDEATFTNFERLDQASRERIPEMLTTYLSRME